MIDILDSNFNELLDNLWNFLFDILDVFFGWINVPAFPSSLDESLNNFLDLIFNNLDFLVFFIRPTTLATIIPLLIFIFNFKYIYKFVCWLIKKIPFLEIS